MSRFYRRCLRPLLFAQQSEFIHDRTLRALGWASRHPVACSLAASFYGSPALPTQVFGLKFPNPVGLAAGMDKQAQAVPIWPSLGFGFSELGGVTWYPQPGNPGPRMFRAVADGALVNRMGFNNYGAEAMAETLAAWRTAGRWPGHPVGVNLGKSKQTPLKEAAGDYAKSFQALQGLADFFVINVSSPNTPNLRQLQDKSALDEILAAIQQQNHLRTPILVKVAPDLTFEALDEVVEVAGGRGLSGIVATNTTIARPETADVRSRVTYSEAGGLSGLPLRARSTEVIRHLWRQTQGRLPIVGVGGIFSAQDAWDKIAGGASLVQVYTGIIYEGPALARSIVCGLRDRLKARGISQISEAIAFDMLHSEK